MKFRSILALIASLAAISGCETQKPLPLIGTWELVSSTSTEKDSTFSTFDPNRKMIKILNATHFAFLNHAVQTGKDSSAAAFSAGGGTYTLTDSSYTENLDYFVDKQWENHKFQFKVKISNDTLTQTGIEKLEKLGIDRIIVEKYKRVKN